MAEPTLGEIQSYTGDANLGAAAGGANISEANTASSLPYIQAASNMVAGAAKQQYDQYQKNLENTLSGLGTISSEGVMDSDHQPILKEYAGFLTDLYKNYGAVRNPLTDLDGAASLKIKEQELRTKIAQSKAQKAVLDVSRKQLRDNPTWVTDENKAAIAAYESKPINERGELNLKPPFVVAIEPMAAIANKAAEVKTASSDLVKNGKYIQTTKGSYVDPERFKENFSTQYYSQDAYGRQIREGFEKMYRAMPEDQQGKYKDAYDFALNAAMTYIGAKQVTESKLDENQVALQQSSQAFQAGENAKNRALEQKRIDLQAESLGKGKVNLESAGRYKNELLANLFTTGTAPLEVLQDIYGDETKVEKTVKEMIPNTLVKNGEPMETGRSSKVLYPKLQVTGSRLEGDQLVIDVTNNETGAKTSIKKSASQANSDFNNILGKERASAVSQGSAQFLKRNGKSENFNIKDAQEIFDMLKNEPEPVLTPAPTVPAQKVDGYSNISSANGKKVGVKNGKWYDITTGQELK